MCMVKKEFMEQISSVIRDAKNHIKVNVNLTMVYAYYKIGKMIFEEEQKGSDRAEYGKRILIELS